MRNISYHMTDEYLKQFYLVIKALLELSFYLKKYVIF